MGLGGRRETMSAPTAGNTSESTSASMAKTWPLSNTSVTKSSNRTSPMSATHTAHSDQANQAAVRWLIPPIPLPCFLVPFVTTITLQDYLLPSTTTTATG